MSKEKLVFVGYAPICYIGQYEENEYWMARLDNTDALTRSTQSLFEIDAHKRFRTEKKCKEYIKKQVLKKCKQILKNLKREQEKNE